MSRYKLRVSAVKRILKLSGGLVKFFFAAINFHLHLTQKRVYCATKNEGVRAAGGLKKRG
jgi:hypothetical protein